MSDDKAWDINPGTPNTECRCPTMDNAYGRRPDDWQWWVIAEGCPIHWPTAGSGVGGV